VSLDKAEDVAVIREAVPSRWPRFPERRLEANARGVSAVVFAGMMKACEQRRLRFAEIDLMERPGGLGR
jgi:hypothetical protein